jgi:hypothetical protein
MQDRSEPPPASRDLEQLPHADVFRHKLLKAHKPLTLDELAQRCVRPGMRLSHVIDWVVAARAAGLVEDVLCDEPGAGSAPRGKRLRLSARGRLAFGSGARATRAGQRRRAGRAAGSQP